VLVEGLAVALEALPPFKCRLLGSGVGGLAAAGPDVAGHRLEQLEALADRVEQGVLDGLRLAVQGRGRDVIACPAGLARSHAQARGSTETDFEALLVRS
jgi:hypothetical protein